jgi:hypothetical protein
VPLYAIIGELGGKRTVAAADVGAEQDYQGQQAAEKGHRRGALSGPRPRSTPSWLRLPLASLPTSAPRSSTSSSPATPEDAFEHVLIHSMIDLQPTEAQHGIDEEVFPSLMPVQRVKLRQKAKLVEWWADRKAKRHARQNRHPDHLTKQ